MCIRDRTEGMLCAFFTAIGRRKKGERLRMNWNAVPGSRGRAKIGIRTYNDKQYNEIKKFDEPDEAASAPAHTPGQQTTFEAGKF